MRDETQSSKRIVLTKLLAAFHRGNPNKLLPFLDEANPNKIRIWSNAIGPENLEFLEVRWASFEAGSDHRDFNEAVCIQQSNRVFARYLLGDVACLPNALEDRADPRLRTYCVHRFKETGIEFAPLIEKHLASSTKADVLYGLLMIVATLETKSVTPQWMSAVEEWVLRQYVEHPDAGVHGMCRFFLAKWGMNDQAITLDERLAHEGIVSGKDWFVNPLGMHMAIIKGKNQFWMGKPKTKKSPNDYRDLSIGHEVTLNGSYAIGMDELNAGQFRRFQPAYAPEALPETPANNMTWPVAVDYCQWLNSQEKLEQLNVSFKLESEQLKIDLGDLKSVKQYRLPTSEEWEYAARHKTVTARFHGQPETPASDGTFIDSEGKTFAFPNRFGLNNVISSLSEWSMTESVVDRDDRFSGESNIPETIKMVLRGVYTQTDSEFINCFYYSIYPANRTAVLYGMRIVLRTPEFD